MYEILAESYLAGAEALAEVIPEAWTILQTPRLKNFRMPFPYAEIRKPEIAKPTNAAQLLTSEQHWLSGGGRGLRPLCAGLEPYSRFWVWAFSSGKGSRFWVCRLGFRILPGSAFKNMFGMLLHIHSQLPAYHEEPANLIPIAEPLCCLLEVLDATYEKLLRVRFLRGSEGPPD